MSSHFCRPVVDHAAKLGVSLETLASTEGHALAAPPSIDTSHPLSHYYIASSHNTYLSGNQLYGKATAESYQTVLEKGCRCVEIDVWDGEDLSSSDGNSDNDKFRAHTLPDKVGKWRADRIEPRVLHGHTATKGCSFRDVAETISLHAFTTSDLPLIISLEIHANHSQQEILVEIIKDYWGDYLVDPIQWSQGLPLPTLEALRKKILIKVKYSTSNNSNPQQSHPSPTQANDDSDEDDSQAVSVGKGKIIPELGNLGLYTRSCHFSSFEQPEATYPTHIFSLSEAKFSNLLEEHPTKLFKHNKNYMLRGFPKGTRITSSNLDPTPFWRFGAQIVALNWQYVNASTMLNHAMFTNTGGYVLKPLGFWDPSDGSVGRIQRGNLDLTIELFAGQSLGPANRRLKAYVKCELHVESDLERRAAGLSSLGEGQTVHKAKTHTAKEGRDVDFKGYKVEFRARDVCPDTAFVRFKVMDDEAFSRDDMVAWACLRLSRLSEGVRLVELFDETGMATAGRLMVRVGKRYT